MEMAPLPNVACWSEISYIFELNHFEVCVLTHTFVVKVLVDVCSGLGSG